MRRRLMAGNSTWHQLMHTGGHGKRSRTKGGSNAGVDGYHARRVSQQKVSARYVGREADAGD